MAEVLQQVMQSGGDLGSEFVGTMIALKQGAVIAEVGDRLKMLVEAVISTERPGSLTITLKVAPAAAGQSGVVTVEAEIKEKIPRPSLGKTIFFATDDGLLVRNNPRQMALKMEEPKQ